MSKKARVALVILVVEYALAALWWYLRRHGLDNPEEIADDFTQLIGQTLAIVMGACLGLGILLFAAAARHDRKAAEIRRSDRNLEGST